MKKTWQQAILLQQRLQPMRTKYNYIANQNHLRTFKLMVIRSPKLASLIFVMSHFTNNYIYHVTLSA
jgi:hypothetical protein